MLPWRLMSNTCVLRIPNRIFPSQRIHSFHSGASQVVVSKLNTSILQHPAETLALLFTSDIASIAGMYGLVTLSGVEFSPEFALAFAASRPLRRLRLPLDLAAAAMIAKLFPAFTRVRLADLLPTLPMQKQGKSNYLTKAMEKARHMVNNYGAAYMMGSRVAGVGVVCTLYTLIQNGIDLMPVLEFLGVKEIGSALGTYAAAVVFSSAFYPITLVLTGYAAPPLARMRKSLF